jgi:lipopolysaccharide/colanic/teichoic acid biosynthesis glycosyltransferase
MSKPALVAPTRAEDAEDLGPELDEAIPLSAGLVTASLLSQDGLDKAEQHQGMAQDLEPEITERFIAMPPHRRAAVVKRFELVLLLIGGLGPALAVWELYGRELFTGAFTETIVALGASIALSWYILTRLMDHANARHLSYVLPVNAVVFLGVFTLLGMTRVPYSGSLFASGAIAAVATSFLLAVYTRRLVRPHVVVSGGRTNEIKLDGRFVPAPSFADLERLVSSGRRDWAIVADLHYPHSEDGERLFAKAALAGIPVYHFRQVAEMQSGQVKIAHLSENDLGSLIPDASYTSIKRLIDIVAALALIPVCLPLFVILALLIRLGSPGNPIFIQERVGFRGEVFKMVKFRTMRQRAPIEEDLARREDAMTKSDDDRITRIGRFLRNTRIDELPQIFNVLRGDMSFIGPRPEACSLSEWYESELPFYSYRHIVRPGITGWAQVNQGHVTDVGEVLGKLRYDFYYIKNISLWLDVLIALKTLRVMVAGIGAK